MSILETVLIFVGIPLLITLVIAVLSMSLGKKTVGAVPKPYRLDTPWTHGPVLWSAVDETVTRHHGGHHAVESGAELIGGSSSGKW
ncbi:hypothetical protein DW322_16915 [Rhodococcus rhodnii]|uniref:Uncharacterized protein n=2 Tax=Rhodococcus rhodnii TaxID=38312 RepID=R7WME1_9NOCA|nr:hypothetical protein [Rhodococcus rhodnii]EOM76463.1 hypothetical protein Rrhod_2258 [Rhodococcus rhodnii LMG 5362]TXG91576.1 hypothetical protein DW322_16915 [Rhodococcus rhodnii]